MARAAARTLRAAGFRAYVETSGPADSREYRVWVQHPDKRDVVAYFNENDRLDAFDPYWIAR